MDSHYYYYYYYYYFMFYSIRLHFLWFIGLLDEDGTVRLGCDCMITGHVFCLLSLGQQRLPDMPKLLHRLCAKKRVSMLKVSARLGITVDTDKPAILARTSARPAPARYAFPVSSIQNSGKSTLCRLHELCFLVEETRSVSCPGIRGS